MTIVSIKIVKINKIIISTNILRRTQLLLTIIKCSKLIKIATLNYIIIVITFFIPWDFSI